MSNLYVQDVIRILKGEVGYLEKATNAQLDDKTANAGTGNWTKYARDLWECEPWAMLQACGDPQKVQDALCYTGPYGAGCGSAVAYYRAAGRFTERAAAEPQPGDQIFFGTASAVRHTGMVIAVTEQTVTTIEGNNGNAVREKVYNRGSTDILGYGRPKWDGDAPPQETAGAQIAEAVREIGERLLALAELLEK